VSFIVSKLGWVVLQPTNLLVGLLLAALLLGWRRLALGITGLLAVVGLLPVGLWLSAPLEERFARPDVLPKRLAGIIVLGGAQMPSITKSRGVLAVNQAAERLIEGLALANRHPEAVLVLSGWSGALIPDASERDVNGLLLRLLQFDESRVRHEDRSRNTWENALYTKALVEPALGDTWVLVTSAAHMPRSVGSFRAIEFPVVPWPVDYQTTAPVAWALRPDIGTRLIQLDDAVREWLGLLSYRLAGRTDVLFPGP
jgi:uncharacterized SAM-binding protein YcdF (DUF218 family)